MARQAPGTIADCNHGRERGLRRGTAILPRPWPARATTSRSPWRSRASGVESAQVPISTSIWLLVMVMEVCGGSVHVIETWYPQGM